MSCIKCNILIDQLSEKFIKCDGCSRIVHIICSELTETELKCLSLRSSNKRRMKYICIECEQGVHQIPKLITLINDLKEEIRDMKERYAGLSHVHSSGASIDLLAKEEIIAEICERNERSQNLMFYGVVESGSSRQDQTDLDADLVGGVLSGAGVVFERVKPIRLGKFDATKRPLVRPIKVRLPSSGDVIAVLRKFKELKKDPRYSQLSVSPDRTPQQISVFKAVKEKLDARVAAGEAGLRIGYRNGIPSIISEN